MVEVLDNDKTNVVLFPGVYDILLKNAQASMEACDFESTIKYCEQALEIDDKNEMIIFALVFSLYELQKLEKAKEVFENYTKTNRVENPDLHFFYLSLLVELKYFGIARNHLNAMMFQKIVTKENRLQYDSLSRLVDIMISGEEEGLVESEDFGEYVEESFANGSNVELAFCIEQLYDINVRPYVGLFKTFLTDESKNVLIKAQLIEILINQQIDEQIKVTKFGKTVIFNPSDCPYPDETDFIISMTKAMKKLYSNDDPSKYNLAMEKAHLHNSALLPLPFEDSVETWSKAYDMHLRMAFGEELDEDVSEKELEIFNFILEIEFLLTE